MVTEHVNQLADGCSSIDSSPEFEFWKCKYVKT